MAKRRMLSADVIKKDRFVKLSHEARCLYTHLCIEADDDGFLGDVQYTLRACLCSEAALRELIKEEYVLSFTPEVIAVRHWPMMNRVPKDRYTPTVYQAYFRTLRADPNEGYLRVSEPQKEAPGEDYPGDAPACLALPVFPLAEGGSYAMTQTEFNEWIAAFPGVDVPQALRSMRAWLLANPGRRKTAAELGRFIFHWLSREKKDEEKQKSPPGDGASAGNRPPSYDIARAARRADTAVPKFRKNPKR